MIPGPAPVTTIHPWSARSAATLRACSYTGSSGRVRADPKMVTFGHVLVRREDPEGVTHLGQRGRGDLEVEAVDVIGGEGDGHRQQVPGQLGVGRRSDGLEEAVDLFLERRSGRCQVGAVRGVAWVIAARYDGPGRRPRRERPMPLPKAKGRPAGTEPVPTTPYGGLVDTEAPPAGRSRTGRAAWDQSPALVSLGVGSRRRPPRGRALARRRNPVVSRRRLDHRPRAAAR